MLGGILVRSGSIRGRAVSDRVECAAVMVIIRACPWWVTGTALEARCSCIVPGCFAETAVTVKDGGALPPPVAVLLPLKAR